MNRTDTSFKSGFCALIGRPNAGKSSLLNKLVGSKIAICCNVSQTTRHRISGIITDDNMQAVIIDTPGIHKPKDVMGQELNATSYSVISDCDIIALVIDATTIVGRGDQWVFNKIKSSKVKKICLLNKCDIATKNNIEKNINIIKESFNFDKIIQVSAKTGTNLDLFKKYMYDNFSPGPLWYPKSSITDQDRDVIILELIREQILNNTQDEIPHSIGLDLDYIDHFKQKKLYKIYVKAYCERKSQIGIVVGSGGQNIKKISCSARKSLEQYLGEKVYLDIKICLDKNWRRNYNKIKKFGYAIE